MLAAVAIKEYPNAGLRPQPNQQPVFRFQVSANLSELEAEPETQTLTPET
jgi:hypothetical protein